jgi:hypothetical protein
MSALNSDGHSWVIPLDQVESPDHLGNAPVPEARLPSGPQPDSAPAKAPSPMRFLYPEPGPRGTLGT